VGRVLRNGLRVAGLAALLGVGAAFLLSGLLRSEAARLRVEAVARSALGSGVRFQGVSTRLAPPALLLRHVVVSDPASAGPPLQAARVRLALAPLPLLVGRLEVRDVRIDEGRAVVRGSARALAALLPGAAEAAARGASGMGVGSATSRAGGFRSLSLHDCELVLQDDRLERPPELTIEGLHGTLRAEAGATRLRLAGRVPAGGRVAAEGTLSPDGTLDLRARLDDVPLAPFAPWFGAEGPLSGTASGTLGLVRRAGESQAAVKADLVAAPVALELGSALLRGPITLRGELALGASDTTGRFQLDASEAELLGPGGFRKPPGRLATADGVLRPNADGTLAVDALRLRITGFGIEGSPRVGAAAAAAARAPATAAPAAAEGVR